MISKYCLIPYHHRHQSSSLVYAANLTSNNSNNNSNSNSNSNSNNNSTNNKEKGSVGGASNRGAQGPGLAPGAPGAPLGADPLASPPLPSIPQLTEFQLVLVVPATTMAEVYRQKEARLAVDYARRLAEAEQKAWREAEIAAEEAAAALALASDDHTKGSKVTKGSVKSGAAGKKGGSVAATKGPEKGIEKGGEKEHGQQGGGEEGERKVVPLVVLPADPESFMVTHLCLALICTPYPKTPSDIHPLMIYSPSYDI